MIPKKSILHTFTTFFLLPYTKLLFTSLSLLLAVHSYNITGQKVSNSAVLLFDPSIRFFHFEHAPYAFLAFFVLFTCIIPPPIILILYPTKFLNDASVILDFKDGTYFTTPWIYFKDGTRMERRVLVTIGISRHFFFYPANCSWWKNHYDYITRL